MIIKICTILRPSKSLLSNSFLVPFPNYTVWIATWYRLNFVWIQRFRLLLLIVNSHRMPLTICDILYFSQLRHKKFSQKRVLDLKLFNNCIRSKHKMFLCEVAYRCMRLARDALMLFVKWVVFWKSARFDFWGVKTKVLSAQTWFVDDFCLTETRVFVNKKTRSALHAFECVVSLAELHEAPITYELDDCSTSRRSSVKLIKGPFSSGLEIRKNWYIVIIIPNRFGFDGFKLKLSLFVVLRQFNFLLFHFVSVKLCKVSIILWSNIGKIWTKI